MKRLLLTYIGCLAAALVLPVLLAGLSFSPKAQSPPDDALPDAGGLPKEISVYFASEGETRMIDLETYVKGVLAAEMPAAFAPEAQKAQAVAARTYLYYKYLKYMSDPGSASPDHPDAVVCTNPQHCNAYYSPEQLTELHGKAWTDKYLKQIARYVDETRGEILVYEDEPILAVFHSASGGGYTEASGEVWGSQLPYLVSVKSEGDDQKTGYESVAALSHADFAAKITELDKNADLSGDPKGWLGKTTLTEGNHIKTVEIGGVAFKGTQIRSAFGLKSTCFSLSVDGENVVFTVEGNGHGVGMSQYGANYMAKNGASYKDILLGYYSGASIAKR